LGYNGPKCAGDDYRLYNGVNAYRVGGQDGCRGIYTAVAHAKGWSLDSAASFHMAREEPDAVDKSRGGKKIRTANGQVISCVGIGQMAVGGEQVILKNVRRVPGLEMNLMSISALCADGWRLVFEENRVVVSRAGKSMTVSGHGGVYPVAAIVSVARTDVEKAAPAGPWVKEKLVHARNKSGVPNQV
jgi:hypothetical protein